VKGMTFNYFCPPSYRVGKRNRAAFRRRMLTTKTTESTKDNQMAALSRDAATKGTP
jgi:hypothetical protein